MSFRGLVVLASFVFVVVIVAYATFSLGHAAPLPAAIILGTVSAAAGWLTQRYQTYWD